MNDFKTYFENTFQIKIRNLNLFDHALTHNSYANEHHLKYTYQRLEFLGDALIGKYVSLYLFKNYLNDPEGSLTNKRSEIVREKTLSQVTKKIGLNNYIRLGNGEEASGGRNKDSILADIFESITGAIYLDNENNDADSVIKKWLSQTLFGYIKLDEYKGLSSIHNYKSELQELLQAEKRDNLRYQVISETRKADNKMEYKIQVELEGQVFGTGIGSSKQEAEQQAAKDSLEKLKK